MQRPPWAPRSPSGGRLGCQEARQKAVLGARRPVGRPSWAPGGPPGGRLGRQEARREAVWAARRPESSVLPTVPAKSSVLRSRQAGRRRQAGCPRLANSPTRKAELDNFCIDGSANTADHLFLARRFVASGCLGLFCLLTCLACLACLACLLCGCLVAA